MKPSKEFEILVCPIEEGSLESFLLSLKISKQKIKKNFSKTYREKYLRQGDEVCLANELINGAMINPHYQGPEIEILAELDDLIVVNKPEGIHCHPQSYEENQTVLNYFRKRGIPLVLNEESYDRSLLFRLDHVTSGVLAFALSSKLFEQTLNNRSEVLRSKEYLCLVEGHFTETGLVRQWFRSQGEGGQKVLASPHESPKAQVGEMELRLLKFENGHSLVHVTLISGRRHQIRAGLAALGFPLVGDTLYEGKESKRVFLHAYCYQILDQRFYATVPKLFNDFLDCDSALKLL